MNRQDVANGKEASAILIRPLGVSTNRIGWDALFVSKFPNNSKTHLTVEFSFSPKEGVFADQLPLSSIWRTDPTIQGGLRPSFRVISDPHDWEKRSRGIHLSRTQVYPGYQSASDNKWLLALVNAGGRCVREA